MESAPTHYILIDHENVAALDPGGLGDANVMIFLGEHTTRLPVQDVKKLMAHPGKVELIEIAGNGRNALDFHIAYYAGRIAVQDAGASIHIVSRDTGFDPLVKHLNAAGVSAKRCAEVPKFAPAARKTAGTKTRVAASEEPIERLITILTNNAKARPRKRKTLASSVASQFKQLTSSEVDRLIATLVQRKVIAIDEKQTVTYRL